MDIAVRNARARDRAYKLSDGRGLCLLVQPNGSKWWRFRYDRGGKEQMLSMGTYPDTSLADARGAVPSSRPALYLGYRRATPLQIVTARTGTIATSEELLPAAQ